MTGICCLIGDWRGRFPLMAAQFARLRGLPIRFCPVADDALPDLPARPGVLIAIGFDRFRRMGRTARQRLKARVAGGATLYLRGGFAPGARFDLWPLGERGFEVASARRASRYTLADHPRIPAVARREEAQGDFALPGADGVAPPFEPLLAALHDDGKTRAAVFACSCGAGSVICDLHDDDDCVETPIGARLADPAWRCANIGALAAIDSAAGRDLERPAGFNLTIDDRPANFDYFSSGQLQHLLEHIEQCCAGARVDFAWTPDQAHPSRRYIENLKHFNTGFVWHGFRRHVDHRLIADPQAEFAGGSQLVAGISRRYRVRFQPVMVFPFERDTPEALEILRREGFRAKAESSPAECPMDFERPRYLQDCVPQRAAAAGELVRLQRQVARELTRDRMLARAMLGLPIIAAAHPADLKLRRFLNVPDRGRAVCFFDTVLDFAASKSLRAQSLEEVAAEATEP